TLRFVPFFTNRRLEVLVGNRRSRTTDGSRQRQGDETENETSNSHDGLPGVELTICREGRILAADQNYNCGNSGFSLPEFGMIQSLRDSGSKLALIARTEPSASAMRIPCPPAPGCRNGVLSSNGMLSGEIQFTEPREQKSKIVLSGPSFISLFF